MKTTDQLSQLAVLIFPLLFVALMRARMMGIKPAGGLGWLSVLARGRSRRGLLARLSDQSLPQTLVVQALGMADVALLALSASALAALGLQDGTDTSQLTAATAAIVAGLCLLLVVRLADDPLGGILLFGVAFVVTLRIAQVAHDGMPIMAFAGMVITLLAPWPVGLLVLVVELATLTREYGPGILTMVLALIAVLTVLGFVVQAIRGALVVVVAVCALTLLAVIGVAAAT